MAALLALELTPLEAVLVSGGPDAAALYGWPGPYPDPSPLAARHAGAVELTDRLVAPAFAVLDDDEAGTLIAALEVAAAHVT